MRSTMKAWVLAGGFAIFALLGPAADSARAQFPVGGINRFAYHGAGSGIGTFGGGYGIGGPRGLYGGFAPYTPYAYPYGYGFGYGAPYAGGFYPGYPAYGPAAFGYPYGGFTPGYGFNLSIGTGGAGFTYSSGFRGLGYNGLGYNGLGYGFPGMTSYRYGYSNFYP